MKRTIAILMAALMAMALLAACGNAQAAADPAAASQAPAASVAAQPESAEAADAKTADTAATGPKYAPEVTDVRVSYQSFCGELYQFIADDKDYFSEEGLNVEEVIINGSADAFTALSAGNTDVMLTYSTVTPLNFIANGGEYTMFAGYMAQGATPLFTLAETEYNGFEDLVGKTIGTTKNGGGAEALILKHMLSQEGYDIEKDFTWMEFGGAMEAIEGVKSGEFDFAFNQTGYDLIRQQYGMKDVFYPDDYYPMYSCCRVLARTEWVEENPETVKALLRAYMRAGVYFEDTDYYIQLMMDKLDQDQETVEAYMLNPHYVIHLDPLKNSIIRDWEWCKEYGLIDKDCDVNIEDHINTSLYKEVLDDLMAENPDDAYYTELLAVYEEYNL